MDTLCDLHTHSCYSDGTLTPTQLVRAAEQAGLSAVALCDHNTVAGLREFMAAGKESTVETVPGIEISADYAGGEVHILGLFLPSGQYAAVTALMKEVQQQKEKSNLALVNRLRSGGVLLDYAEIKAATPGGFVNRTHIATALAEKGYAADRQEAFQKYLARSAGYYIPPQRLTAEDTIRFLKSLGAVVVLAHPFLNLDADGLRGFLESAVGWGLDGMETEYPLFDETTRGIARYMAEEYGILSSGGSDFHGANKPDIRLGTGKGDLRVPMTTLQSLRNRA